MPRAFAQNETAALGIEGPAGAAGILIRCGQGGQAVETRHAERVNHAVRPAADHDVGIATAEDFGGFADRLRAGGAGREAIERRAARASQQAPGATGAYSAPAPVLAPRSCARWPPAPISPNRCMRRRFSMRKGPQCYRHRNRAIPRRCPDRCPPGPDPAGRDPAPRLSTPAQAARAKAELRPTPACGPISSRN